MLSLIRFCTFSWENRKFNKFVQHFLKLKESMNQMEIGEQKHEKEEQVKEERLHSYEEKDYCGAECGNLHKEAFKCSYSSYYRNMGYGVFVCSEKCVDIFNNIKRCQNCGVGRSGGLIIHNERAYCTNRLFEHSCYAKLIGIEAYYCSSCNQEEREEDMIETGYSIGKFKFCKTCFESAKFETDFNEKAKTLFNDRITNK